MKKKLDVFISIITVFLVILIFLNFNKSKATSDGSSDLNVQVLDFSNNSEGDCTIITIGDTQILIDSGKKNNTVYKEIEAKLSQALENDNDKVWEYVIFTHADADHIGNSVAVMNYLTSNDNSIGNIIDFDMVTENESRLMELNGDTKTYKDYRSKRMEIDDEKNAESKVKYFSASTLSSDNLYKTYEIENDVTLTILYNYFDDFNVINGLYESSKQGFFKNIISVCTLLEYHGEKLLFTGDLEERDSATSNSLNYENEYINNYKSPISKLSSDCKSKIDDDLPNIKKTTTIIDDSIGAERTLLAYHRDKLSNVLFYKAAHHGSKTSNSGYLMDCIKPEYIAVTAGPGGSSNIYKFPNPIVLNSMVKYTDYIYPTSVLIDNDKGLQKLFGNLNFKFSLDSSSKVTCDVTTEFNNSISENAKAPEIWETVLCEYDSESKSYVQNGAYYLEEISNLTNNTSFSPKLQILEFSSDNFGNCTLLKMGHYDILIDCGSFDNTDRTFINKVKEYCYDGILEYVIITKSIDDSYSQMIGTHKLNDKNGIFDLFKIDNLIDFNNCTNYSNTKLVDGDTYTLYTTKRDELINNNKIKYLTRYNEKIVVNEYLYFKVFKPKSTNNKENYSNSLTMVFDYKDLGNAKDEAIVFTSATTDYSSILTEVKDKSVIYLRAPTFFGACDNETIKNNVKEQIQSINPINVIWGCHLSAKIEGNDSSLGGKNYLECFIKRNRNVYGVKKEVDGYNSTLVTYIYYDSKYEAKVYNYNSNGLTEADKWISSYYKNLKDTKANVAK